MEKMEIKDLPQVDDWRRKWSFRVYVWGIVGIIILGLWNLVTIAEDGANRQEKMENTPASNETELVPSKSKSKSSPTLTELVIQPIAQSPKFQVIFEYLFYLLLWLLLWLLIPSAFQRLTRFKLFNLEFELDRNQHEVIHVIDQQMRKFKFLTYLMKDENKDVLKTSFDPYLPRFKEALEFTLSKMQSFYLSEWDQHLSFDVMTVEEFETKNFPAAVRKSIDLVDKYQIGVPINKENPEVVHHKNYLVYTASEEENIYTNRAEVIKYVIIISSYRTEFNENDGYLLAGITSLVSELHKRAWENLGLTKLQQKLISEE
ncbi:hypothetical protein ELQ35_13335 [Peribacillus cavernae]|uniref:Uncharacterized protein n=1 Tax=Peribacillus cavernae TaxID=1674310 RepID=A0A433HJ76_9BACI|nr:hypothetical protein [Peribacillus cavernae]MDQ0217754.1 hypothetical protein [Peribacillus cavernae]RUQ28213.1 hypothetical protein ELQ35_13335 [Peribacillus cavernae]